MGYVPAPWERPSGLLSYKQILEPPESEFWRGPGPWTLHYLASFCCDFFSLQDPQVRIWAKRDCGGTRGQLTGWSFAQESGGSYLLGADWVGTSYFSSHVASSLCTSVCGDYCYSEVLVLLSGKPLVRGEPAHLLSKMQDALLGLICYQRILDNMGRFSLHTGPSWYC